MPELHGVFPLGAGPASPCVWCGVPTDVRFNPEGMPQLGPQPQHILCGAQLIRAYERLLAGHTLTDAQAARLRRLAGDHAALT